MFQDDDLADAKATWLFVMFERWWGTPTTGANCAMSCAKAMGNAPGRSTSRRLSSADRLKRIPLCRWQSGRCPVSVITPRCASAGCAGWQMAR